MEPLRLITRFDKDRQEFTEFFSKIKESQDNGEITSMCGVFFNGTRPTLICSGTMELQQIAYAISMLQNYLQEQMNK
jgi:hypothetical protein